MARIIATIFRTTPRPADRQAQSPAPACTREDFLELFAEDLSP